MRAKTERVRGVDRSMNTTKRGYAMLPMDESEVLFMEKDIDFGFPKRQLWRIEAYWKEGDGIIRIAEKIGRKPEEVALALFEMMMDGKIDDLEIRRKPKRGTSLLVPGKEILKQMEGGNEL